MPLSTSSSNRRQAARSQRLNIVLFSTTFLVLCAASIMLRTLFSLEVLSNVGSLGDPKDYYLSYRGFGGKYLDPAVLYFGKQGTARHMKSADVLFLGSSRINYAMQDGAYAKNRLKRLGMTHYTLGFGSAEAGLFPLNVIRKHDLRPKFVVVNAEFEYFVDHFSSGAIEAMQLTLFEYRKLIFEEQSSYYVQRQLHAALPHWSALTFRPSEWVCHRCRTTGTWILPQSSHLLFPIKESGDLWQGAPHPGKLSDIQKKSANLFKEEMDKRRIKIIITHVPYPTGHRRWAELFARHLDSPLVAPVLDDLYTIDPTHLSPQSARRWAEAFFTELEPVLRPNSGTSSQRP